MSVCVAALAADSKAIVCVADKALSYGGYIQWDSDSSKILGLDSGASLLMFSHNGNGPRVLAEFSGATVSGKDRTTVMADCEGRYIAAMQKLIDVTFLRPRLLDRNLYVKAITTPEANHLLRGLADEIKGFDMECHLIVCGFDANASPFILDAGSPGIVGDQTGTGFQAVGSGSEKAISRLLFSDFKRDHSIERVLYEAFDAKANAEMAVGVGYEWDAKVLVHGKAPIEVPQKIKDLLEKVWSYYQESPFGEQDPVDPPPRNWNSTLKKFAIECLSGQGVSQASGAPR